MSDKKTISKIELSNRKTTPLLLTLEPWGDELLIPGDAIYCFIFENNSQNDPVTIEFHADGVAVFGIRDSMAWVYHGSELLWECWQVVSPPVA